MAPDLFCNVELNDSKLPPSCVCFLFSHTAFLILLYPCQTVHLQNIIFQLGLNVDQLTELVTPVK